MRAFKADIHIHSVLSPCADLGMSPTNIVNAAIEKGLDFIGISDHNSTLQTQKIIEIGCQKGLTVFPGVEVTTKEEVHCLCYFENTNITAQFQKFIDSNLPRIKYKPETLGYQVLVNENDEITDQIDYYLGIALKKSIDEICSVVHQFNGLFVPAHINRSRYSIISQLGFIPNDLEADAFEAFNRSSIDDLKAQIPHLSSFSLIKNSDAHFVPQIGSYNTTYFMEEVSFAEFKQAICRQNGRYTEVQ